MKEVKEIRFKRGADDSTDACKAFSHATTEEPLSLGELVAAYCDLAAHLNVFIPLPEMLRGIARSLECGGVVAIPSEALAKHIVSRLNRPDFDAVNEMGLEREMENCEEHPACPRCKVVKHSEVGWIHCNCSDTENGLDDGDWIERVHRMELLELS